VQGFKKKEKKMKKAAMCLAVLSLVIGLSVWSTPNVSAAEHGGKEHGGAAKATAMEHSGHEHAGAGLDAASTILEAAMELDASNPELADQLREIADSL
jgi:hypothetical protein